MVVAIYNAGVGGFWVLRTAYVWQQGTMLVFVPTPLFCLACLITLNAFLRQLTIHPTIYSQTKFFSNERSKKW
jgi:hypothetical protein